MMKQLVLDENPCVFVYLLYVEFFQNSMSSKKPSSAVHFFNLLLILQDLLISEKGTILLRR